MLSTKTCLSNGNVLYLLYKNLDIYNIDIICDTRVVEICMYIVIS